jgi:hypothetical protein
MTDKEKLKALFLYLGIGFVEIDNEIRCEEGCEKIKGYWGFSTSFMFTEEGNFVEMGAYE